MIVLALSRRGQEQGSSTFSNNRETALLCMVDGRLVAPAHLLLNPRDAVADGRGGGGDRPVGLESLLDLLDGLAGGPLPAGHCDPAAVLHRHQVRHRVPLCLALRPPG
jgi:hypothetical protein